MLYHFKKFKMLFPAPILSNDFRHGFGFSPFFLSPELQSSEMDLSGTTERYTHYLTQKDAKLRKSEKLNLCPARFDDESEADIVRVKREYVGREEVEKRIKVFAAKHGKRG